ncbi:hypothetical protein [Acidithiobacillus ferrivorans]|uniref:Lipoprotein n=1 Tax=Acidithiobacillus ferrivorans TaxID=160808 RepID=A0A7T5BH48_9PROT|nr:hypothetical protein [Acidithiobacillus ferrivorans]QQD73046.1 hypothetical protein H2515_01535 [Acidithiobacillus ferrivorans]
MKIYHVKPIIASLIAVMLAGCVSAPSIMPQAERTQYPTLHRAMENTSVVEHWKGCSGGWGNYYRECQTEFINQSVGPVPLLVAAVGAKHLPTSMRPLNDAMDIGDIVNGATMTGFGGLASGSIGLGLLGLLSGGASPDLAGLHRFQSGNFLYAVHFESTRAAANSFIPNAAMLEAQVSAKSGGAVVGHTSFQFDGVTWKPHKERWRAGSGSFGIFYKARPKANGAAIQPFAVWDTRLKPLMKAYAVTDQWEWATGITQKERDIKVKTISAVYPGWTFVASEGADVTLICTSGFCHTGPNING